MLKENIKCSRCIQQAPYNLKETRKQKCSADRKIKLIKNRTQQIKW